VGVGGVLWAVVGDFAVVGGDQFGDGVCDQALEVI
jgi:hypothetical protein